MFCNHYLYAFSLWNGSLVIILFHGVHLSFSVKIFSFYFPKGYIYNNCVTQPASGHFSIILTQLFVVASRSMLPISSHTWMLVSWMSVVSFLFSRKLRGHRSEEKMLIQSPGRAWLKASDAMIPSKNFLSLCSFQFIKVSPRIFAAWSICLSR